MGGFGDEGSAARFFYCAKASREERDGGLGPLPLFGDDGLPERQTYESRKPGNPGGDNPRNRGANLVHNNHPTVKPLALMRYLITLITPPKGIILDPFCGSGTTLKAAKQLGFKAIGIDIDEKSCEIASKRCNLSQVEQKYIRRLNP
jgi:site-specific DNA-methyltransferase (adenine-specific)